SSRRDQDPVRERHHDHAAPHPKPRPLGRLRLHGRQSRRRDRLSDDKIGLPRLVKETMAMSQTIAMEKAAIEVSDLNIEIRGAHGSFAVVSDMSLSVRPGETLCIVGESGCGKSMTALSLLRLLPEAARVTSGKMLIEGKDFLAMGQREVEQFRGEKIAMIFQEPLTALNPVLRIGEQIAEGVREHRQCSNREAHHRAIEVLRLVQMPDPERRAKQFPHELSGGMRQRAMIALALACDPSIIIADEPTTALDVTIQAQILGLISDLQK